MPKDCWAAAAADGRKVPRFPQNVFSVRKADAGQRAETEARFVLLWLRFNGRCGQERKKAAGRAVMIFQSRKNASK